MSLISTSLRLYSMRRGLWLNQGLWDMLLQDTCHVVRVKLMDAGALVPSWAEGIVCRSNIQCRGGDCEQLHLPQGWESRRCKVPENRGKLVVCAGPERSGSTWLFNAVRLLLEGTNERVHSYWLHEITTEKLKQRGFDRTTDASHLIVKTHEWSDEWDPSTADLIFLTDRDLCGVINSYLRIGWLPHDMQFLKSYVVRYLRSHNNWKAAAHAVIPFDHLADVGNRELESIIRLEESLKLPSKADPAAISAAIRALPVPSSGGPDPLTKLWPRHIGAQGKSRRPSLTREECEALQEHASILATR